MKKNFCLVMVLFLIFLAGASFASGEESKKGDEKANQIAAKILDKYAADLGYKYKIEYVSDKAYTTLLANNWEWSNHFRIILYVNGYRIDEEKKELILTNGLLVGDMTLKNSPTIGELSTGEFFNEQVVLPYGFKTETIKFNSTWMPPDSNDVIFRTSVSYSKFQVIILQ